MEVQSDREGVRPGRVVAREVRDGTGKLRGGNPGGLKLLVDDPQHRIDVGIEPVRSGSAELT